MYVYLMIHSMEVDYFPRQR